MTTVVEQPDAGAYEVIKSRLEKHTEELENGIKNLDELRQHIFGTISLELVGTERIATEHNCVARDMVAVGNDFIFGYNVYFGLKAEMTVPDVFQVYEFRSEDHSFYPKGIELLKNEEFEKEFAQIYKYYKDAVFANFAKKGNFLYMVFRIGKGINDIKTFKWQINGDALVYVDNRSDHEVSLPPQYEFKWERTHRDLHRDGLHPHISIQDRLFVETVGGDLTIKVEDNTDSGEGIYAEPVEDADQTLDDAEFLYASLDSLILLKILPYQEKEYRYFVYNEKQKEVKRIDKIGEACILLPENQGIIFSNGYYLQTGEFRQFDSNLSKMSFVKKIASPNGEDYLYIFFNQQTGEYVLLSYNQIKKQLETPIVCNGYAFFYTGELTYFKSDETPKKNHALQYWKTPYTHPDYEAEVDTSHYLYKVGPKEIVNALADTNQIISLCKKGEQYTDLYLDISNLSTQILDSYYWLEDDSVLTIKEAVEKIRQTAAQAIEAYEKVQILRKNAEESLQDIEEKVIAFKKEINLPESKKNVESYVDLLYNCRKLTGEAVSLKSVRYINLEVLESLEEQLIEYNQKIGEKCIEFLLNDNSLVVYEDYIKQHQEELEETQKGTEIAELLEKTDHTAAQLELLTEIVSNLKIDDPTKVSSIVDSISDLYADLNTIKAAIRNKGKQLREKEGLAEYQAQSKLLSQSLATYIDLADTAEKCDEYLSKLALQVEELEGKFADFESLLPEIISKREEIYQVFETKKLQIIEGQNRKVTALYDASLRILKGIQNKSNTYKEESDLNGYFATDLMVSKLRNLIKQINSLNDAVRAEELEGKMKVLRENAFKQLKDKKELYSEGNTIKLGKHNFATTQQDPDVVIMYRNDKPYYHLTGTKFFQEIEEGTLSEFEAFWSQEYPSENKEIYRAEYLAWQFLTTALQENKIEDYKKLKEDGLLSEIQEFMSSRFQEGYLKGVHDKDALIIFKELLQIHLTIGLLKYSPKKRAFARLFWNFILSDDQKIYYLGLIKGQYFITNSLGGKLNPKEQLPDFYQEIDQFLQENKIEIDCDEVCRYLCEEIGNSKDFIASKGAINLQNAFVKHLKAQKSLKVFEGTINPLKDKPVVAFQMILRALQAFTQNAEEEHFDVNVLEEAAIYILQGGNNSDNVKAVDLETEIVNLVGEHRKIKDGKINFHYNLFRDVMVEYLNEQLPQYQSFIHGKKEAVDQFRELIQPEKLKANVPPGFVRNSLINEVYLPLIGDNFARQLGTTGASKKTNLNGLLLLLSPPGYGKTTLMEYIANRLGLIFAKINGPAIGHEVTSLDPEEAPNSTAKEELIRLNMTFEMADNVMLYIDDIQHCNPEFLQKFISLCDGQRKIEGVYQGRTKTYDLRGNRLAVVMAGNPYTETGEKFKVPDMLANRADTYNLGEIIGNSDKAFKLSYIENSMTSNPLFSRLTVMGKGTIDQIINYALTDDRDSLNLTENISEEELQEYVNMIKKMIQVQEVVLKVNREYVYSASQADEYRTEPSFKMQGSYRNMNKICEKLSSIMTEEEVNELIFSHYEGEAQTLTSDIEGNLLKFKSLVGNLSKEDAERWEYIKTLFMKQQQLKGYGANKQMVDILNQLVDFNKNLGAIKDVLSK